MKLIYIKKIIRVSSEKFINQNANQLKENEIGLIALELHNAIENKSKDQIIELIDKLQELLSEEVGSLQYELFLAIKQLRENYLDEVCLN